MRKNRDSPQEFPGIYTVLSPSFAEPIIRDFAGDTGIDRSGFFPVYRSPQRNTAQIVSMMYSMSLLRRLSPTKEFLNNISLGFILTYTDMWLGSEQRFI